MKLRFWFSVVVVSAMFAFGMSSCGPKRPSVADLIQMLDEAIQTNDCEKFRSVYADLISREDYDEDDRFEIFKDLEETNDDDNCICNWNKIVEEVNALNNN